MLQWQLASFVHEAWGLANLGSLNSDAVNATSAETRDRTGDLQIFSLTLSQLSYRGHSITMGIGINYNTFVPIPQATPMRPRSDTYHTPGETPMRPPSDTHHTPGATPIRPRT